MILRHLFFAAGVLVLISILFVYFGGSRQRPRFVRLSQVEFPCIRIFSQRSWEGIEDQSELESMLSGRYMNRQGDPVLIDANFRMLNIVNLKSKSSELGLIFSGPTRLQVIFDLQLQEIQSQELARTLLVETICEPNQDFAELERLIRSDAPLAMILDAIGSTNYSLRDESVKQ